MACPATKSANYSAGGRVSRRESQVRTGLPAGGNGPRTLGPLSGTVCLLDRPSGPSALSARAEPRERDRGFESLFPPAQSQRRVSIRRAFRNPPGGTTLAVA